MHTSSEKKIKIILLASGYNELQEGNAEYRIEKVTNQFKKTRQFELNFKFNRIYITPNPSNPYNLTLLIKGQLRTSIEDSSLILSEPILENTELTSRQEQEIINGTSIFK